MVRCTVLTQHSKPTMCFEGLIEVVMQRACEIPTKADCVPPG